MVYTFNVVIKKVGTEALDSKYSYADQELPKWQSTMKEEYPPKPCVFDRDSARDLATSMKGCHFVLESPGATNVMQSSTKRDFIRHQYSTVPERYHKTVTEKRYSLTDFEGGDLLPRKVKEKIVHLDERFSVVPSTARYMANVSLGNDTNDWKSVSCSDMVSHPSQPNRQQTEYETLEKKKSSVLDNPDLVLDPIMTVNQAEYTLSDQLDRSTLIYDNSLSKKALKGTHFSLGNDQKMATQSEYLCSFVPLSDHRPRSMIGAQSSDKSCIIAEDYEDRAIGVSSQKLDYKPITSYEPMNTHLEIKVL
jgi:hypothetical protein